MDHPSRYALVEVVNIHDPALDFAPIHRLLFGVTADVRQALAKHSVCARVHRRGRRPRPCASA